MFRHAVDRFQHVHISIIQTIKMQRMSPSIYVKMHILLDILFYFESLIAMHNQKSIKLNQTAHKLQYWLSTKQTICHSQLNFIHKENTENVKLNFVLINDNSRNSDLRLFFHNFSSITICIAQILECLKLLINMLFNMLSYIYHILRLA